MKHCVWRHNGDSGKPVSSFFDSEDAAKERKANHEAWSNLHDDGHCFSLYGCESEADCRCQQVINSDFQGDTQVVETPGDLNDSPPAQKRFFGLF